MEVPWADVDVVVLFNALFVVCCHCVVRFEGDLGGLVKVADLRGFD